MPTHRQMQVPPRTEAERRMSPRRSSDQPLPWQVLERRLGASPLSPREREIARLVFTGHANKEIAHRCSISEQTVKDHLKSAYRKLGVRTRTALVAELLGLNHHS